MDKIEKFFTVSLFTLFSALLLDKVSNILRESNALLLSEALHTSSGFIVSIRGYNEVYIIGIPILIGYIGALLAIKLSEKEKKKE